MPDPSQPTCPACGGSRTAPFTVGQQHRARQIVRPYEFFRCGGCGLRFQVVDQAAAARLYADIEDTAPCIRKPVRRALRFPDDIVEALARLGPGRRVLDVGSGDGEFLAAAVRRGFEGVGLDVSPRLAALAQERSGARVLVGQLTEADLPRASFDCVNLDQVISYMANPRDVMREVADLLCPGGTCRIREYNPESLSARLKGKAYWMYAPTIVSVWTPAAIAALARASGLRLVRVIAGTEASLGRWLATAPQPTPARRLRDTVLFLLRRTRLGPLQVAADTVYYLQKPASAGAPSCSGPFRDPQQ